MPESAASMNFEDIYREYSQRVLNLAYRFSGDEEIARDLTQDVFTKIYQNLHSFQGKSQLYTWIYRLAVNHFINFMKKERRWRWMKLMDEKITDLAKSETVLSENWMGQSPLLPDRQIEKSEREKIILGLINRLPIKYRVPLILQRYENMNNKKIAETLSLSVSAVETRLHRARKLLVSRIEPWLKHL